MRSRTDHGYNDSNIMRTPVAWKNRDHYLNRVPPIYQSHSRINQIHLNHHRNSSPSTTTTSSDDREEVPMVKHSFRKTSGSSLYGYNSRTRNHKHNPRNTFHRNSIISYGQSQIGTSHQMSRNATLQSTRSFPGFMMATWDGKPCPIHGHSNQRLETTSSLVPQPLTICPIQCISSPTTPLSPQFSTLPSHSTYMTMKRLNSASDLRKLVMLPLIAANGDGSKYIAKKLPLSVPISMPIYTRPVIIDSNLDSLKQNSNGQILVPEQHQVEKIDSYYSETVCCKGHLIVLWIILGVITIGVIAGIVLGITAN